MSAGSIPALPQSVYSRCPFRLLGCSAEATPEALEAAGREALAAVRSGPPRRPPGDLPWLPEVRQEPESLRQAWDALHGAEDRLRQRLFWPHQRTEADRQALAAARAGRFQEAVELWTAAWNEDPGGRLSAAHNLFVLYHSRGISAPRGVAAAARDFEQARAWWRRLLEGGRLGELLRDGEGEGTLAAGLVEQAEKALLREVQDLLHPKNLPAARRGPIFGPGWTGNEAGVESYEARRAGMLLALEQGEEAARQGDRAATEAAIERARGLTITPSDTRSVEEAGRRMLVRLVMRGLKTVRRPPLVVSFSGLGTALFGMDRIDPATRSYETRLMFTLGHLPLLPLGRYRVRQRADGSPEFLGKLPADFWTLLHGLVALALLMVSLWGAGHLQRLPGYTLTHLVAPGGAAQSGPAALSPQEIKELQRSREARKKKLAELERVQARLEAEQQRLTRDLERWEKERDREARLGGAEHAAAAKALDRQVETARERLGKLPGEIRSVQEVRRELEALEHPTP